MEEPLRWFGPADSVSLVEIRQTGATAVFSALHDHLEGSAGLPAVVCVLLEEQVVRRRAARDDWRLTLRPDHGRMMLDDFKRPAPACPGYPLIGRLRGLAELRGLQVGLASAGGGGGELPNRPVAG